jgi:hypothetical protein
LDHQLKTTSKPALKLERGVHTAPKNDVNNNQLQGNYILQKECLAMFKYSSNGLFEQYDNYTTGVNN